MQTINPINLIMELKDSVVSGTPAMIWGGPGIGKSDIPTQVAKDLDMNIIMNEHGDLIEIQGTAEGAPFSRQNLNDLLDLAWPKIDTIIQQQKAILATPYPYE